MSNASSALRSWVLELLFVFLIAAGMGLALRDAQIRTNSPTWQILTTGEFARAKITNWTVKSQTFVWKQPSGRDCTTNDYKWATRACRTQNDTHPPREFKVVAYSVDLVWRDHHLKEQHMHNFVVDEAHVGRLGLDFQLGVPPPPLPIRYRIPDAEMDLRKELDAWDRSKPNARARTPCMPALLCKNAVVDAEPDTADTITVLGVLDFGWPTMASGLLAVGSGGLVLALLARLWIARRTRP